MPLTPEDVRNKRFTPVRLREGYDMGEVDQFLDEVEAELERLAAEGSQPADTSGDAVEQQVVPPAASDAAVEAEPAADAVQVASTPQPEPLTVSGAAGAAARILEIAGRNADELVAEAKEQVDTILSEARSRADELEAAARVRADTLDAETEVRRTQLVSDLEGTREALSAEVEHLRTFEREYRSRLRNYFSAQLAQLNGDQPVDGVPGDAGNGSQSNRLQALLAEDKERG